MPESIINRKSRLFCPGPTPVPMDSALRSLETNIYHRSPEFKKIFTNTADNLKPFFDSQEPPIILTSSGTGALEAAVSNLTDESDEIIVINGGKFGERWKLMTEAFRCRVHTIDVPWGQSPDIESIAQKLKEHPNTKALFIQANETSTGVAYPIKDIAECVRATSPDVLIIVDAVSALVAHHVKLESWDLDCVISGSQKGFGVPPGLAFIALSERALERMSQRPRFYFDLSKEAKSQKEGQSAWTPATSLILALEKSIQHLNEVGVEACVKHHKVMSEACRRGIEALELKLFSQSNHSQALTAVKLPVAIDGSKLVSHCREKYGAYFAGGQDQVKGKIIRIAHLGIYDQFALLEGLSILECGLSDLGYKLKHGSSVGAAMQFLQGSPLES